MNPQLNWLLIIAGAILILLEILLGAMSGFDLLLIGSAILLGGALGLVLKSGTLGLVAAGALSLAYIFLGRQRLRGRLRRPGLPSNVDAILGRTAQVVEEITLQRPGRVKLEGEEWRALPAAAGDAPPGTAAPSRPIPAGSSVQIMRVDGVTVYVSLSEAAGLPGKESK